MRMEIGADYAAARHRREHGDAIEKPEPVERAEAAEMKGDGAGAAARQSQADFRGGGFAHAPTRSGSRRLGVDGA